MLGSGDGGYIIKLRGLPFSTTAEDVLDFMSNVNVINGKEGVHLTEVRPGRPSGECYVEVESQDDVDKALKKDKENMGKRYIEVFAVDRQDMDWAINAMRQSSNGGSYGIPNVSDDMSYVKLRGLPYGCSKEEIEQFFDGVAVPNGVHLLSDSSGRASGEAFVQFNDAESAERALGKDREKIGHRYIEVFISSADEVRSWSGGGGGWGRGGRARPAPYDRADRPRTSPYAPRSRGGYGGSGYGGSRGGWGGGRGGGGGGLGSGGGGGGLGGGGHAVHMRGLPFKATPQDIAYFFKPIRPVNINILFDSSGRPSGEADVEFECHEDAMRFFKPIRPVNINILFDSSGRPSGEVEVEFECHEDAMRAMRRDESNMDHRYIEL